MIFVRMVASLLLLFLVACTHHAPAATVELIDTSLSITSQAEKAALDAVRGQILRMDRGDTLVLIPITGNAENDAGGRILRLQAPTKRESYDADLRRFRDAAQKQFTAWAAALGPERCRTDILGSLDAARQELAATPKGSAQLLIVASDFLEDDDQLRFATDQHLANAAGARIIAARLRSERPVELHGTAMCLGRLESVQFESLSPSRREAIRVFWIAYLAQQGRTPDIQFDGLGMLADKNGCAIQTANNALEVHR
jgi:hypothetical protein